MTTPPDPQILASRRCDQIRRILELADQHLQMDLAFLAECTEGQQVYQAVHGDAASFSITPGVLQAGYCGLMLDKSIPAAIPNTANEPSARDLPITAAAGIGAYIGVPIVFADGTVYGSLGCLSHQPHDLGERDLRFLQMLAELAAPELELDRQRTETHAAMSSLISTAALDMALQPVFDIHDGRCLGAEALARFPAKYGNTESVFRSARAVDLGLRMERLALSHAIALLPALPPEQFLAVNLTPDVALEMAHVTTMRPAFISQLVLEITEHAAVDSYAHLRQALLPLRELGLRLAIDDAGAGYASLKHVIELEPDIIKVDRSIIDGVSADRARRSVVSAFVLLGLDIGASVTAEGIETLADLEAVRDLGVDAAQGYLFARPTTDREAPALWARGNELAGRTHAVNPALLINPQAALDDAEPSRGAAGFRTS